MGISEVFAMVASFEFAYLAAPRSAQSLIMSLRFCSLGLSSFIGEAYVKIFTRTNKTFEFDVSISSWKNFEYIFKDIFQCGKGNDILYVYFYVLGGIQLLACIIFILCNRKFEILRLNPHQIDKRQFN